MSKKFPRNLIMSENYRSEFEPMNVIGDRVKFLGWFEDLDKTQFTIYLGNRLFRLYDDESLPDLLKIKLAMIGVYQMHDTPPIESVQEVYWAIQPPPNLIDVGFSIENGSYYALISTYNEFMELKGRVIQEQS